MTIGERIFNIMEDRDMTQLEFSRLTGIAQSTISDWKRKRTNPASDKILIICEVLEISPNELLQCQQIKDAKDTDIDYMVVSEGTEAYKMLVGFEKLDRGSKDRLLGYLSALIKE
ncbi:MAG: helix-turn-helix transcriptional regulator [Clostridiales bacterium]|nr:helix-turn-helix transcriptional regulator [Clostridiales bacterium]